MTLKADCAGKTLWDLHMQIFCDKIRVHVASDVRAGQDMKRVLQSRSAEVSM